VEDHYPFDAGAQDDAPVDDFIRLFAPGGMLDSYYQAQIKPYVDTRGTVWRAHALGGVAAPVDAATIASFQRAAAIRDIFFPLGGRQPQIQFTLTPAGGTGPKATLTLGSQSISTDATRPVAFNWPGADGMSNASLVFSASNVSAGQGANGQGANGQVGTAQMELQENGPWALFRLLAEGRLRPGRSPETYALTFSVGDYVAAFTLQAGSAHNPFGGNMLSGFQCPVVQ
jgi:type VI secretion system protein ImpL